MGKFFSEEKKINYGHLNGKKFYYGLFGWRKNFTMDFLNGKKIFSQKIFLSLSEKKFFHSKSS
jgi:hypothetical protein